MDLCCLDGRSVTGKYVEWTEMKLHKPAGTFGMKASEVKMHCFGLPLHVVAIQLYFTGKNGEPCGSQKSDIWSGCVAMMNALVGKDDCDEANEQVHNY